MNARLALAAAALLIFGGAAGIVLRRPAPGEHARMVTPFHVGAFDTIEVDHNAAKAAVGGARTTLHKQAGGTWVTAPVRYAADPTGANAAFEAIDKLDAGAIVTTRAQRFAELQVDAAGGIGVRALLAGRVRLDLVVGKKVDDGTMVRLRGGRDGDGDGDAVWQVNGDLRAIFDKKTSDWRDRSVTTFSVAEAREIAVDTRDGQRILLRRSEAAADAGGSASTSGQWSVIQSSAEIGALDELTPKEMLAALSALKAGEFADGTAPAAAGLAPPALTVTVTLRGGEKDVVLVGDRSGADEFFVKTNEGPQIFLVKSYDIDRLARRPIQFRDKLLCRLSDADIEEVSVTNGVDSYHLIKAGTTWRAAAPRSLRVDPDKVAAFSSIFRSWRAPRIAEEPPPEPAAPLAIVNGSGPKGNCMVRVLGLSKSGQEYFVKAPPAHDVFMLPRWMIDRVAVKLDEIRAR